MLTTAHFLRTTLADMRLAVPAGEGAEGSQGGEEGNGQSVPIFQLLDAVGEAGCREGAPDASAHCNCLPVVAATLNPALRLSFDCIDLQHVLSETHW